MEFKVHEVVPEFNIRTNVGRVVINPPSAMGPLVCRTTGTFFMCCNRAFLTEDAYKSHIIEQKDHGKAVDFSKFPKPKFQETSKHEQNFDSTNRNLWIVRKKQCAKEDETNEVVRQVKKEVSSDPRNEKRRLAKASCALCDVQMMVGNLSRHMKTCHVPDGIKCDYCCCTFILNRSRLRHQFVAHGIRIRNRSTTSFKKNIIARAKKTLKSGIISSKLKSGTDHVCHICGKDFFNKHRIMEHMNSHTGVRPFKCELCGFKFTHRSNLHRHEKRAHHPSNKKVVCKICKCNFSTHQMLARHYTTMHPKKLKIKKLDSPKGKASELISDQKYDSARKILPTEMPSLKLECPSQNSSGSYACHVCLKELSTPQTWRGHMLIHQNLKPYKCKHCGISFRLSGTRQQHMINSHTGGAFKCQNCTCRFKAKRALLRHMQQYHSKSKNEKVKKLPKIKTEDKQKENTECEQKTENVAGFKCNLCGTVVKMLKDFEAHKTLHTTTDRSRCNLCLKQFASAVNAKIHKKRAHGDAAVHVYGCAFCCCRYTSSFALYSHLVKEHEMNKEDWDSEAKSIKTEARRRIQYKLCTFDPKPEVPESKADKAKTTTFERKDRNIATTDTTNTDSLQWGHECDICHIKFKLARSIYKHKKVAHNHGTYICGICPCRYNKMTWLKKHQLSVHGYVKPPKRNLELPKPNDETFATKNLAKPPVSSKHSLLNGTIECHICKFKFKSRGSLMMHQKRSHFHSGKFKCPQCSCKFQVLRGLKVHLNLHHGYVGVNRQKLMQKLSASKPIINEEDEDNALDTNTNKTIEADCNELIDESSQSEKKFECDLCNMKFSHRSTISNHKKKSHFHSGKFKCSKCSCKFLTPGGLLNHKKFHHGFAGKGAMKRITELKKNVELKRTKSPTKLASQTEDSNIKQKEKVNLNRQTLSGSAIRVECKLCNLMVSRGKIATHIETSHGAGTLSCRDCACVFTKAQGLLRHRIVYHGFRRRGSANAEKTNCEKQATQASSKSNSKFNLNFLKIRSPSSPKRNLSKIPTSPEKNPPVQKRETDNDNVAMYPSKPPRPASAATNYKFKCDQCGIKFTHTAYLRRHKTRAHAKGEFSCSLCSCTFINAPSLAAHKRVYHSLATKVGPSTLKRLKKSVQNKLVIKTAKPSAVVKQAKRSGDNNQSDSILKKTLSNESPTKNQPNTDIRTRHKTRLEDISSSENTSRNNLGEESVSENSNTIEPSVKAKNQCTWCLKTFHLPKLLEKHILSHTRPEICGQCGLRFRSVGEVSAHVKTAHDKRSSHECPICSCRFATAFGLSSHHTKIHKKQSASYDNIVIEHDEGVAVDDEPFIESVYPNQNEDGLCDDSEPIIQGILETNYSPNEADEEYDNEANFQEDVDGGGAKREFQEDDEVEVYEDSVPIIQGVLEYDNSGVEYPSSSPSTNTETKKSFSPKSRPIKCCTCGITCYGPANLRLHMQSHQQDIENEEENVQVDDDNDGNFLRKCDKCTYEFKTSHDLSQHMQLEHDESGLYRCAYCPCTMKNETNLRYHFLRYHSG